MSIILSRNNPPSTVVLQEKITGPIADVLKDKDNSYQKFDLVQYFKDHNYDFNRSMKKPIKVDKSNTSKLKSAALVIGVCTDDYGKKKMSVWSNEDNKVVVGSKIDFHNVRVSFANMSWDKWIEYCDALYVVNKSDLVRTDTVNESLGITESLLTNRIIKLSN